MNAQTLEPTPKAQRATATAGTQPPNQRQSLKPNRLTPKQEAFCRALASGMSNIDAYRRAYNAKTGTSRTHQAKAQDLLRDERIRNRVDQLRERIAGRLLHDIERIADQAIETIFNICRNPSSRDSDRLRAAELLGKVRGVDLFSDIPQQDQRRNNGTMIELERRIKALLMPDQAQRIEITHVAEIGHKPADQEAENNSETHSQDPTGPGEPLAEG